MTGREKRRAALLDRLAELSEGQRKTLARDLAEADKAPTRQQLTAYIAQSGNPPGPDELKEFLEDRLPEYMIPSRYFLLEQLPRTPAGKLDRRGVHAEIGVDLASRPTGLVPPRNEAEARLAEIWKDVIGIDEISVHDDFFEIGGDSLLSIRAIARAERAGITISPEAFFAGPTIARLAALDEPTERRDPLVVLRSGGTRPAVFGLPGVRGNAVVLSRLARELGPDRPFYALESRGLAEGDEPLDSIEAIAEDFVEQMLPAVGQDFHVLGVCWGSAVAFEIAARLGSLGKPPRSLSLLDPTVLLRKEGGSRGDARLRFLGQRLELYWDEFRSGDWRTRGHMMVTKARVAANGLRSGGKTASSQSEMNALRVHDANLAAVIQYRPQTLEAPARLFLTEDRELRGGVDPRFEWVDLIEPKPDVVWVPGFDTGDAVSANVASFATALRVWLDDVEGGRR